MLHIPNETEYPSFYEDYIKLVPNGDLITILQNNLNEIVATFQNISEEQGLFRYASSKWSIKEVLGHITDTERIMSYRLLRIGRGDQTPLAGFDENVYVNGARFNELSINTLLDDFIATRNATLSLIHTMSDEVWDRKGSANKSEITARAIAYLIVGHAMHHHNIVLDKYLSK